MEAGRRYVLISPCRDEAAYMRRTLDTVAAQSVPPALWIVVDDGSKDETPAILEEYARKLPQLKVVRRTDRGNRRVGPGVIEAFYHGLDTIDLDQFDYVCKLDMDLELPPRYFELLMRRMEAEPRLGTTSGKPWVYHPRTGKLQAEPAGDDTSAGMTKFYRVSCFRDIGGFVREVMWDGIDCHRARMLGWIAESVDDPPLRFVHLRAEGSSQKGIWTGRTRAGFGQYFMGTSLPFYVASATYRLFRPPAIVGSAGMLWGFVKSALERAPRYPDLEFRRFLRSYQYRSLVVGKNAAARRAAEQTAELWNRKHGGSAVVDLASRRAGQRSSG